MRGCLAVVAVLAWFAFAPTEASAKFFLITHGNQIRDLGPIEIKPTGEGKPLPANLRVGFINDHAGLFWLDIWTWNGRYCVYTPEGYDEVDEEVAALLLGKPGQPLGKPLWYRVPALLLILVCVGLFVVVAKIYDTWSWSQTRKKVGPLVEHPEYLSAYTLLGPPEQHLKPDGTAGVGPTSATMPVDQHPGYSAAHDRLMAAGVDAEEATKNLAILVAWRRNPRSWSFPEVTPLVPEAAITVPTDDPVHMPTQPNVD